jgi:hypothetical protein
VDTWLIVFAGTQDWTRIINQAVADLQPRHIEAHHILFLETPSSQRWALLLVHWLPSERDKLIQALAPLWEYGFINSVSDLNNQNNE